MFLTFWLTAKRSLQLLLFLLFLVILWNIWPYDYFLFEEIYFNLFNINYYINKIVLFNINVYIIKYSLVE